MSGNFKSEEKVKSLSDGIDELEQCIADAGRTHQLVMHKNTVVIILVIILAIVCIMLPRSFWIKASKKVDYKVDPKQMPVMRLIPDSIRESDYVKERGASDNLRKVQNLAKTETFYIIPLAQYSVSGRVTAKNKLFFNQTQFDKLALIDIGLVWGILTIDEYFDKLSSNTSELADGSRQLNLFFTKQYENEMRKFDPYLKTHFSQTHVIPANKKIMAALSSLSVGEAVKMEGYLVDIFDINKHRIAKTSLSLNDANENSRSGVKAGGASEIMYVMRVQIGKKIFE